MECLVALCLAWLPDLQDPKPDRPVDFGRLWAEVIVRNPQDSQNQDGKKLPREDIVISFPVNYFSYDLYPQCFTPNLVPPPENTERHYYFQHLDYTGALLGKPEEVSQDRFYHQVGLILGRGVNDGPDFDPPILNDSYRAFVRTLFDRGIVSKEELAKIAEHYFNRRWIESAYCLDDAVPGITTKEAWVKAADLDLVPYLATLARIKAGDLSPKALHEIAVWLDEIDGPNAHAFKDFAQAYAELIKVGCALSPESHRKLFSFFDKQMKGDPKNYAPTLKNIYAMFRLTLPDKEVVYAVLRDRLKQELANDNLDPATLIIFRELDIRFPKEFASAYRDILLTSFGDLESIDYFIQIAGEDAPLKLWKRYANDAFHWHFCKENRKNISKGDYYHMAVEGYKRAIKLGGSPPDEQTLKKLLGEMDDLSVRMRDLITAHELAGQDPKYRYYLEKLEQRAERYDQQKTGAFYVYGLGELSNWHLYWQQDDYMNKLVPFRDAIELAAHLKDAERIRGVSRQIADYAVRRLVQEKEEKWIALDSPVFAELDAIYELYRELDFKIGARSLAHHLHEAGFVLPARKFYHLGGIGKEAEEQFYSKHDDAYWEELQKKYNKMISKTPLK